MIIRSKDIGYKARKACVVLLMSVFLCVFFLSGNAHAGCRGEIPCCIMIGELHDDSRAHVSNWHEWQREIVFGRSGQSTGYGTARLGLHEVFLIDEMFMERLLPAMMMMTEQLVSNMMMQTLMIGAFFDAKIHLETQLTQQRLSARAHKDYHPDFQMCVIGTNVRSLAAAEYKGDMTQIVLSERFVDRNLLNEGSVSAYSPANEKVPEQEDSFPTEFNRAGYFLRNTCDRNDYNKEPGRNETGLWICRGLEGRGWVNRDIDFANTVLGPRMIDVDFNLGGADNQRVLEMANYLYAVDTMPNFEAAVLQDEDNIGDFLKTRSIVAKRSIAQNSFNNLVALKSRGTHMSDPGRGGGRTYSSENTAEYMRFILQQLGIPETPQEIYYRYLSQKNETKEPSFGDNQRDEMSYYAQMEILSKKIFQRPEFYTGLYDKPENINRKAAALQAIGLMLERDVFDSHLRQEMMISMLLELKVIEEQRAFENQFALARD